MSVLARILALRGSIRREALPETAVLGDRLSCLTALQSAPSVQLFRSVHTVSGRHRSAVIGVDITGRRTAKELRQLLREVEVLGAVMCGRLPRLEHIVIVVAGSTPVSSTMLHRICDRVARRIAQRIGDAVREVAVTAFLVEECDDPGVLADRVLRRLRRRDLYGSAETVELLIPPRPLAA